MPDVMQVTECGMNAGTYAQWASAGASLIASCVALGIAVWNARRQDRVRAEEAEKRTQAMHKALLLEVRENRQILQGATPGWSYVHLRTNTWEAARSDVWVLPEDVAARLQEAYCIAEQVNDVVDTHIATEVAKRSIYDQEFKRLSERAKEPFRVADQQLTEFLQSVSVHVTPFKDAAS